MRTLWTILLSLTLLAGLSACGEDEAYEEAEVSDAEVIEDETGFASYDLDGNSEINDNEFNEAYGGAFDEYDENDDGLLDDGEFSGGLFDAFDANDDDILDENEYNAGFESYYGDDYEYGFSDWDADGDSEITEAEFGEGFGTYGTGLYDDFDADGNSELTDTEFGRGMFGIYDADESGFLDENEYNESASYYDYEN